MRFRPLTRPRVSVRREPLRTLREMAEELGVPYLSLRSFAARHRHCEPRAPRPEFGPETTTKAVAYYKPSEVRAWWRLIQDRRAS